MFDASTIIGQICGALQAAILGQPTTHICASYSTKQRRGRFVRVAACNAPRFGLYNNSAKRQTLNKYILWCDAAAWCYPIKQRHVLPCAYHMLSSSATRRTIFNYIMVRCCCSVLPFKAEACAGTSWQYPVRCSYDVYDRG